jgi:hypothetical protein
VLVGVYANKIGERLKFGDFSIFPISQRVTRGAQVPLPLTRTQNKSNRRHLGIFSPHNMNMSICHGTKYLGARTDTGHQMEPYQCTAPTLPLALLPPERARSHPSAFPTKADTPPTTPAIPACCVEVASYTFIGSKRPTRLFVAQA